MSKYEDILTAAHISANGQLSDFTSNKKTTISLPVLQSFAHIKSFRKSQNISFFLLLPEC